MPYYLWDFIPTPLDNLPCPNIIDPFAVYDLS